jgi:acyl carrier protein
MTFSSGPPDPFTVVAQALRCSRDSLSIESAMYRDHGWDSFGHVSVTLALEEAYGISIPNDRFISLTTMKAIIELLECSREDNRRER